VIRPTPAAAAMSAMLISGSRARHSVAASRIAAMLRRASARRPLLAVGLLRRAVLAGSFLMLAATGLLAGGSSWAPSRCSTPTATARCMWAWSSCR
jgi:hypothetical protein